MLVLAMDTASPTTSVAVVDIDGALRAQAYRVCSAVDVAESRRPAEQLAPAIEQALAEAGVGMRDVGLLAVGVGPGPFTGLRAGLVTARVLGGVLSVPVVGVVSLDALMVAAASWSPTLAAADLVVATDARRREVYWAAYSRGARVFGPSVSSPAAVDVAGRPVVGRGAALYPEILPGPAGDLLDPPAWAVAVLAARSYATGDTLPADPLYLRRPDVAEPAPRKRVLAR